MSVTNDFYAATKQDDFLDFGGRKEPLAVMERSVPPGSAEFFADLSRRKFAMMGLISRSNSLVDLDRLLEKELSPALRDKEFYSQWVDGMATDCRLFCDVQHTDSTAFRLGSQRGCTRYHVDNVPMRLLVTYAGTGTEWLPENAVSRNAYAQGLGDGPKLNKDVVPRFLNAWDIAVFKGGPDGLLHRTPDAALTGPSVMMRLDHPAVWKHIFQKPRSHGDDVVPT